jgi:hypothetical protein
LIWEEEGGRIEDIYVFLGWLKENYYYYEVSIVLEY